MSNPFEFRETLAASFAFGTDQTPEQVALKHKRADEAREAEAEAGKNKAKAVPVSSRAIPQSALDQLAKLKEIQRQNDEARASSIPAQ